MKHKPRRIRLSTANAFTLVGIFVVAILVAGLVYSASLPAPTASAQDLHSNTPTTQQHQATLKDYLPPNFRGRLYILSTSDGSTQNSQPTVGTQSGQQTGFGDQDHDSDDAHGELGERDEGGH